jgi:hypothetical protein
MEFFHCDTLKPYVYFWQMSLAKPQLAATNLIQVHHLRTRHGGLHLKMQSDNRVYAPVAKLSHLLPSIVKLFSVVLTDLHFLISYNTVGVGKDK